MKPPTYHLAIKAGHAACGVVGRYPDRAVVPLPVFNSRAAKYGAKICSVCKRSASTPAQPSQPQGG